MVNINETSVAFIKNYMKIKLVDAVQSNWNDQLGINLIDAVEDILATISNLYGIRNSLRIAFLSLLGDVQHTGAYVKDNISYGIDIKAFFSNNLNGYVIQIVVHKEDDDFDEYIIHVTNHELTLI